MERSLLSLKKSIKERKTAQSKAADFVKRYNSSVFYDKSLMLENHTAARQCELLRPERINRQSCVVASQRSGCDAEDCG